ncbi:MAG: aldo/keto reductase [Propionibacteriaceae bacterium]|jgi:2,5-diketo-D-gluconate reductase A|nr:aldo/keto reductase [Propionibacteriaceae bacterium]
MKTITPTLTLNQGTSIPQLGFGVFRVDPATTQVAVEQALEIGYRHIDTATGYDNESGVGAAVRASGLKRGEIFVTTKLRNDHHMAADFDQAFQRSIDALGIGYIDLYLIHWPMPKNGQYVSAWEHFENYRQGGLAKAIGVSNFNIEHLETLAERTGTVPAVNQVELHPVFQQRRLRAYHDAHGIRTEAWAPLGQGRFPLDSLEPVNAAAAAHGKTPVQVILRWHMQEGTIAIPKSVRPARMAENLDIFDFELSDAEFEAIRAIDTGARLSADPNDVNGE